MDARAHLRGLGWQGEGHSLGKNGHGLKKPLLVTHKTGLHGLGAKSQKEKQADQWWLNAFDNALKDIGTGKESALSKIKDSGAGRGGLYGYFVRGAGLEGTFESGSSTGTSTPTNVQVSTSTTVILSMKDLNGALDTDSTNEARQRKKDKRGRKEQKRNDKKRKREEDAVDNQDGPEVKTPGGPMASPETAETSKTKKNKKNRSENARSELKPEAHPPVNSQTEDGLVKSDFTVEQQKAQKEERRKAKAERRARREEKSRKKQGGVLAEESDVKRSKKERKKPELHQAVK
jgi:hypothetical protein